MFFRAVLRSYSMLFFSQSRGAGALLLLATLVHPWAGAAGLLAATLAVGGARLGNFSRLYTDLGAYSFNSLLVGLVLPLYFRPGWALAGVVVVGAGLALLLSVALGGWLGGRGLPFLSLPFIFTTWLLLLGCAHLPQLPPAEASGLYWLNDAYALGGPPLVAAARWITETDWPPLPATYLRALSAVLLQDNVWAGLLAALALLWHSRIAFSLSVLAFLVACGLASLTGTHPDTYNLGANYLMAAVTVGAVFALPSAGSYGLALLSLLVTAVLLGAAEAALPGVGSAGGLPTLSLPYCGTALLLLYVLLLREQPGRWLTLTPWQRYSPEANLYAHLAGHDQRLAAPVAVPLALPFLGEWRCTQGYADGGPTHQGPWGQALDFVVADADGGTHQGSGRQLSDYYCYNKPVLAPADGVVETVVQHLPDNTIGEVDTRQNWGNTVVLRHAPGLYSQLSHLRPQSVRVQPGQAVRRGEVLAACGNSGRSPEPHLHFQVQAAPAIGSPTLAYPFSSYQLVGSSELKTHAVPQAGDAVQAMQPQPQLTQALRLPPGYQLAVRPAAAPDAVPQVWEVFTDAYNARYLRCTSTGAVVYFEQNEAVLQFTAYYGAPDTWLHAFYLAAYRVPLGIVPTNPVPLPLAVVRRRWLGWLQDVVAPFGQFVRPIFTLRWPEAPGVAGRQLHLSSEVVVRYFGQEKVMQQATLTVADGALAGLTVQRDGQEIQLVLTEVAG